MKDGFETVPSKFGKNKTRCDKCPDIQPWWLGSLRLGFSFSKLGVFSRTVDRVPSEYGVLIDQWCVMMIVSSGTFYVQRSSNHVDIFTIYVLLTKIKTIEDGQNRPTDEAISSNFNIITILKYSQNYIK